MREIKFRAWNKETSKMCDTESLQGMLHTERNNGIAEGSINMKQSSVDKANEEYEHLIFMQYISLKDKNDEEIYEGDVMKGGISYDWREDEMGIVEFGLFKSDNSGDEYSANEVCGWNIKPIKLQEEDDMVNGQFIWKDLEIIGNIYENPELLEGK